MTSRRQSGIRSSLLSSLATRNNTPPRRSCDGGDRAEVPLTILHPVIRAGSDAPGSFRHWRHGSSRPSTPPLPSLIADIKLEHWFYLMLDGPFTLSRVLVQFYSCYSVTRSREQNKINPGTLFSKTAERNWANNHIVYECRLYPLYVSGSKPLFPPLLLHK